MTGRPRVLLIEDHADTRAMYVEFLGFDYEVGEAGDGLAGFESASADPPDVIITDLALPRLDGYALIERLRSDERLRDIPIIALSGYSGFGHDARVTASKPDAVLQKPCLPEELADEINKQLARRSK